MARQESVPTGSDMVGASSTVGTGNAAVAVAKPRNGTLTAQFLALALTWGASFLFIKVGLEGLSPVQLVLGRMLAGALTLLAICAITRRSLPRGTAIWLHLGVVSLFLCVFPFLLFAWAEQHVSSGLASIYNATTPLMTTLAALVALPQEKLSGSRLAGLLVGLLGVAVVIGLWNGAAGGSALAQGACLLATACYGVAFVYLRRKVSPLGLAPLPLATAQVGLGAGILLLTAPWTAGGELRLSVPVVLSVLLLGALGTGLAYVWNTSIVAGWGATNASTVTYLTPVVGVILGVLVLQEKLSWNQPVGAFIVVVGIALTQSRLNQLVQQLKRKPGPGAPAPS